MTKTIGKPRNTYSAEEVIEFRDDDHTPWNKRSGEVDSSLVVQVRAPEAPADWVNFNCEETTTTKNYDGKPDRTQSRTISFTMKQDQFVQMAAHVRRNFPAAIPTVEQLNAMTCSHNCLLLLRILETSDLAFFHHLLKDETVKDILKVTKELVDDESKEAIGLSLEELCEFDRLSAGMRNDVEG